MVEIIRFDGDDGAFMLVEVARISVGRTEADVGLVARSGDGGTKSVTALERSMGSVRGAAIALMATVREIDVHDSPLDLDEVSLDLALSFTAEGSVVVAKGSAAATASITLTWRAPNRA